MSSGDVNAVTWGIFPGKEIVQSTIIEEESFKAWRVSSLVTTTLLCSPSVSLINVLSYLLPRQEEAFAIWDEWSLLYPARSETSRLLRSISDSRWLVTVVHHDYKDEKSLWRFLGCGASQ